VPLESEQQTTIVRVPYARGLVVTCCGDVPAIGRENRVLHRSIVGESGQQATVAGVPHSGGMIIAGTEDAPTIGREDGPHNYAIVLEDRQWFRKCLGHRKVSLIRLGDLPTADG